MYWPTLAPTPLDRSHPATSKTINPSINPTLGRVKQTRPPHNST